MSMEISREILPSLIAFARENSPFYGDLYRALPETVHAIEQLPVLSQQAFWEANRLEGGQLLTGAMHDGIVLKSGGTTGNPKFSVFSRTEWNVFVTAFSRGLALGGLQDGDRVANLFYVGELYGSFLFTHKALEECPKRVMQLPIAGATTPDDVYRFIKEFKATVLAGVPTTMMSLVDHIDKVGGDPAASTVRLILFAGEAMYPDQRARLEACFPGVEIRSIGYASTDAGLLGFADLSCGPNEFRCYDDDALFEIIDEETGSPIVAPGIEGLAVVTALRRHLMPILRYPVGDRARWVDAHGTAHRKFLLRGRSDESARIGPVTLYPEDVRSVLASFPACQGACDFQLLTIHRDGKDGLILRIGNRNADPALSAQIIAAIYEHRPMYGQLLAQGKILPIDIEWVDATALEINPRSGKLKRVIDRRFA